MLLLNDNRNMILYIMHYVFLYDNCNINKSQHYDNSLSIGGRPSFVKSVRIQEAYLSKVQEGPLFFSMFLRVPTSFIVFFLHQYSETNTATTSKKKNY